jgi:hypothetical protein
MSSILQCENDIKRYRNLKDKLNTILYELLSSQNELSTVSSNIKNKYQVNNDTTPIYSRVTKLDGNIDTTYNYIKNKIIPSIDSAINSLNKQIDDINEEEESKRLEEKRKRLEEQRKKGK